MKIAVWDTYVERPNGERMHFDILVPSDLEDKDQVYAFGEQYLESKPFKTGALDSKKCNFCHFENATAEVETAILQKGYYILEMENCL
ncbi:DUF2024 family protein [Aequorivita sp. F47161]|uniref:DUF2024 family protein n=1 Tax=Aequorivita vitellina TaxID=2874475 RepID=A0A9X1QT66_9FLAO|nr:DUF2024 family protein [Aequorivita vitellina]MCG2418373.1 DUF2024 family protein [Aequorivita vitellina]MCZ4319354.1 DUF2024 family protein [Aequorivita viscosa]